MKDTKYDIALVLLGAMVAFFIGIASTAVYDLFKDLAFQYLPNHIEIFQTIFVVVPLCIAFYLFREILKDHL